MFKLSRKAFLFSIAESLLAGPIDPNASFQRTALLFSKHIPILGEVCIEYAQRFHGRTRPRTSALIKWLQEHPVIDSIWENSFLMRSSYAVPSIMWPSAKYEPICESIPAIVSLSELQDWLSVSQREFDWLCDWRCNTDGTQYQLQSIAKKNGSPRILEIPCGRLEFLQRRILKEILDVVPLPNEVHGFRRQRSIRTFAEPHCNQSTILRMDLLNFFPNIASHRVAFVFRSLGYPERVSDALAMICTHSVPENELDKLLKRNGFSASCSKLCSMMRRRHLPQGAPSSPSLANICAERVDRRLIGLARSANVTYSRYGDDLAFSGPRVFGKSFRRFADHVAMIVLEEGFEVNFRKTRFLRCSTQQKIAGVVVNQKANSPRRDFEQLKATLHNCHLHGWQSQNRRGHPNFEAHLRGRIEFIKSLNSIRGEKLMSLFEKIDWGSQ